MSEKKIDYSKIVRQFIENKADFYNLKIYHCSLLKVIAEYCDMSLGYCCLNFATLAKFSRMSESQRRSITKILIKLKMIHQTYKNDRPIHRIGELITGIPIDED